MPDVLEPHERSPHHQGPPSAPPLAPRTGPTSAPRAARCSTRSSASRRELSSLFVSTWPRKGFDFSRRGARGGPRMLTLAELEGLRDDLAERVEDARRSLSRPHLRRGEAPPPHRGDAARAREAQVGADRQRGHRRARLQALARATALGHPRDAHELVAGPDLQRLPVSHGASAPSSSDRKLKWESAAASARWRAPRAGAGTTRAERDAARRERARQARRTGAPQPRLAAAARAHLDRRSPAAAVGLVPAHRAGHPGRHRADGLGLRVRPGARRQRAHRRRPGHRRRWPAWSWRVREHVTGFRSHTTMLAGAAAHRRDRGAGLSVGAGLDVLPVLLAAGLVAFGGVLLLAARAVQAPLRRAELPVRRAARHAAGSGVLLVLIMLGGGLAALGRRAAGWLYIGSQVQAPRTRWAPRWR